LFVALFERDVPQKLSSLQGCLVQLFPVSDFPVPLLAGRQLPDTRGLQAALHAFHIVVAPAGTAARRSSMQRVDFVLPLLTPLGLLFLLLVPGDDQALFVLLGQEDNVHAADTGQPFLKAILAAVVGAAFSLMQAPYFLIQCFLAVCSQVAVQFLL